MDEHHQDDEFHPPTSDDPYWTETCWFTFTVPERRLSGQLYPFFQPNQGVWPPAPTSGTTTGHQPVGRASTPRTSGTCPCPTSRCRTSRSPTASPTAAWSRRPLRDRLRRPRDGDEISVAADLHRHRPTQLPRAESTSISPAATGHDHPPRRGDPASIPSGSGIGRGAAHPVRAGIHGSPAHGGYSYATASESDGFHTITMDCGRRGAWPSTATCSATGSGPS